LSTKHPEVIKLGWINHSCEKDYNSTHYRIIILDNVIKYSLVDCITRTGKLLIDKRVSFRIVTLFIRRYNKSGGLVKSLKHKFSMFAIIIAVAPIMIISVIDINNSTETLEEQIASQLLIIAERIKLLALNTTIEAACIGAVGKSSAVVAG